MPATAAPERDAPGADACPLETIQLDITGMTCASCVARVEKVLGRHEGVHRAEVNLATGRARVTIDADKADAEALAARVTKAGYETHPTVQAPPGTPAGADLGAPGEHAGLRTRLIIAALLTLPVFVIEMGGHLVPAWHHLLNQTFGASAIGWLQFVLATAVMAWPGRAFFSHGLPALARGAPDMNTLVAVGSLAAWAYSVVALIAPTLLPEGAANLYFEPAAVIVTLILLGRWLESRARARTTEAISLLAGLQPATARVRRDDRFVDLPIAEIRVGDTVLIRPGERVPIDGTVLDGQSHVDESMLTGEPLPAARGIGDALATGTLNQSGALTIEVTHAAGDTVLDKIVRMVEDAQGAKMPIQAMVDQVAAWFVPVVMGLAALTFVVWVVFGPTPALSLALVNAVAVLIIACPCAMGLATPTSVMVGIGRAARLGLLFRNGAALQALDGVRVMAFDKTGTLTVGHPQLTDLIVADGADETTLLTAAASVEQFSEHPIARAIVTAAEERGSALQAARGFEARIGHGAVAELGGERVLVGSADLMATEGLDVGPLQARADDLAGRARSIVFVARGARLLGLIAVADPLKPDAREALAALRADGLRLVMLTGDNALTARSIAAELGIDEVHAQCRPEDKLAQLNRLREAHGRIAFVGDGINDAPTLAGADVGIAMGSGTDTAMAAADVVSMAGRLSSLPTARRLAAATLRNIRQNLFWAFAYNVALIPLAAGALYPLNGMLLSPHFAALAMAMSSVFVVSNALRLRRIAL
ncbi:MAG: heavy metal translocating P-type ATPase [Burkholderiaceae bacterium]